jgi:hypothetical protein
MPLFFSISGFIFVDKIQFLHSGGCDFHIMNIKIHIKFKLIKFIKLIYSDLCNKYVKNMQFKLIT